ncbi:MAG TPA: PilC/PilY family type IV pilus protein, partial [Thermoanaerobaculia bacterium]|nr:PilC/PilY family type IV pilus protein [Thermoanaerobaculia bacterium]
LWEMTDSSDADANGKPDMGQTWSKPVLGRIKVLNGGTVQDQWVVLLGGGFDPAQSNSTGNAFYILDATTGKVLYKVQSGRNGTGSSVLFGSMPATAAAVDINDSGYIDIVYIGDTKGQMWKVDLRPDATATPPRGVLSGGKVSGYAPFLLFFHNDPTAPHQVFFEPTVVLVSTTSAGKKNFGIAFGSGDRENLLDPTLTNERFYFVLDDGQTTTETDADLTTITPTSPVLTSAPARGWVLRYANGNEKTTSLALVAKGFLIFTTFTPIESSLCTPIGRATRYAVFYLTGNPLPGGSRSEDLGKGAGLSQFQTVTGKGELITAAETTYQVYKLSPTKESIGSTIRNWKEQ